MLVVANDNAIDRITCFSCVVVFAVVFGCAAQREEGSICISHTVGETMFGLNPLRTKRSLALCGSHNSSRSKIFACSDASLRVVDCGAVTDADHARHNPQRRSIA